jgi:hypothetical protein
LPDFEKKIAKKEDMFAEELEKRESEIEVLTSRILEVQKVKAGVENEQLSRDAHISRLKKHEKELLDEIEHLRRKTAEQRDQIKIAETKLKEKQRGLDELDIIKRRNAENLEWLERSLLERDRNIESLEESLKEEQKEIENLNAVLEEKDSLSANYEEEVTSLKSRNEDLLVKIDELNNTNQSLQAEAKEYREKAGELAENRARTEQALQALESEKAENDDALQQLRSAKDSLLEEMKELHRSRNEAMDKLIAQEAETSRAEASLNTAEHSLKETLRCLNEMTESNQEMQKNLLNLDGKLEERVGEVSRLNELVTKHETAGTDLKNRIEQLAGERVEMNKAIEERDAMLLEMDHVLRAVREQAALFAAPSPVLDEPAAPMDQPAEETWWSANVPAHAPEATVPPVRRPMHLSWSFAAAALALALLFGLSHLLPEPSDSLTPIGNVSVTENPQTGAGLKTSAPPVSSMPASEPGPVLDYKVLWEKLSRSTETSDLSLLAVLKTPDEVRSMLHQQAERSGLPPAELSERIENELGRYDFQRFYYLSFYARNLSAKGGINKQELLSSLYLHDGHGNRTKGIAPAGGFKPRIVDTPTKQGKPKRIVSLSFTAAFDRGALAPESRELALEIINPDTRLTWDNLEGQF